jgi:hypothetical protein
MSLTLFLIGASAAAHALSANAQEMPADPPPEGLSDLSSTLETLDDSQPSEQPDAEPPASPAEQTPAEPAPPAEESPAEAQPSEPSGTEPSADPAGQTPAEPETPAAVAPAAAPPPDSAELRAELESRTTLGRQLFAVARAGLLATQDMLSRVADPEAAGITGWVAEPEGNAIAVTFYGDSDAGPVAIYRARILGGRAVSRDTYLTSERPPLSGTALRLALARAATGSEEQRACTNQPFNVVALPPASPDAPIHVYRITPPESRTRLPMGGHFRTTVGADGTVAEARAFSRGCLNLEVGEVPAGSQAGPIAVTHLLDPLPTEMHVFLSLFSGRPLLVAAGDPTRLFMVAGDQIREIRR